MKPSIRATIQLYWQHLRPHRWLGVGLVLVIVSGSILATIIPIYYKQFFDILSQANSNDPFVRTALLRLIGIVAVIHALQWILWRLASFLNNRFQPRVIQDLLQTCFTYLHRHSFTFFQNNFVGSLVKQVNRFADAFENIADNITWFLLKLCVQMIVILIVLFSRKPLLAFVILAWVILYTFINWLLTNYKFRYDRDRSEAETKATGLLADTITNHSNVKLWNGYEREVRHFHEATDVVRRLRTFTWDLDALFEGCQAALMVALELGMFYVAIYFWQRGVLTVGDFVLIQAYLLSIFEQVWNLGRTIRHMYERLAEAGEMTEILKSEHEIQDHAKAKPLIVTAGEIVFDRVHFYYHHTRRVITNLSLHIAPGEKIALIGPSGAGKSTLVKLLLRLHDVSGGRIRIDGQNIAKVTQESLWQQMSFVPQEPVLFHRTLGENIRYGKPEATDEEVKTAATLAYCHEFIQEFPQGYDTFVGERGIKLSGGERQRVAIARAILRNAPILVLDEATSSLDSESEHLIQEALTTLMKGKTVIVIAHRLSTVMKMDRIIVIDQGGILEEGTHAQLTKKRKSLYRRLWERQAGGFLTEDESTPSS